MSKIWGPVQIFLLDRIELGKQSLEEYQNFADSKEDVQATENTAILLAKLKSKQDRDRLIVTSIQKMSNIKAEEGVNEADIEQISSKRLVFIIDEAHRTTFGDMLLTIKHTFPKPHTMQQNIERAVKLYSGDRPMGLFVDNLDKVIHKMNVCFAEIADIFKRAKVADFAANPDDATACAKFVKLFNQLNDHLQAARLLGFVWEKLSYDVVQEDDSVITATLDFDQETYDKLLARYKDLFKEEPSGGGGGSDEVPFDLRSYINEIETDKIDQNYMNARFEKWLKAIGSMEEAAALEELHHSFATLSKEDQKFAELFLHDVQSGDIQLDPSLALSDYITTYKQKDANDKVLKVIRDLGLDGDLLRALLARKYTSENLDLGRLNDLKETVDREKAKVYFNEKRIIFLNIRIDEFLRELITR